MEELQSGLGERGLTVSTLTEKGRCLLTTRDFHPGIFVFSLQFLSFAVVFQQWNFQFFLRLQLSGEVIISEEAYVCVPNNSSAEWRCEGCFSSKNLKKCSACQVVWYCGSQCQVCKYGDSGVRLFHRVGSKCMVFFFKTICCTF